MIIFLTSTRYLYANYRRYLADSLVLFPLAIAVQLIAHGMLALPGASAKTALL
ncbi:hypothetical protein [Lyngbya confervoides]|uniref:ABC transporter n=1 Tax=Lyngbya confervoides BDU141951 TaxID=1574623 RepID=A0ABD4T0U4_9CYAN|nr:hypothetical protein [Lyngbya confervoides]MCM1981927.1 hypothetical protein [Lyngbya confervoides BDU141951]